jgi:hypothetical protein
MGAQHALSSIQSKQPFKRNARTYFDRGWLPMPLPPQKKDPPPDDFTGWEHDPKKITISQIERWISEKPDTANICCRPRRDHIGIDVDFYNGPDAQEVWKNIQDDLEEFGGLPDTWISSARDDGTSGIRHYRLAEQDQGKSWHGTIGKAVQFVHLGHRYAVLPPSVHPSLDENGKHPAYQWYEPGEPPWGFGTFNPPTFDGLPVLATEIVDYFTHGQYAKHLPEKDLGPKSEATAAVAEWIEQHGGEPCARMASVVESIADDIPVSGAHDTVVPGFYRLACLAAEGHSGLSDASSRLEEAFRAEVGRDDRTGTVRGLKELEEEWLRLRDSAVKKVLHRIAEGDFTGSACTCTGFTPEGTEKIQVDVRNFRLDETLLNCYRAVRAREATNWFGVYHLDGRLRELTHNGLRLMSVNTLRTIVSRRVDWVRWISGDNPRVVPALPPTEFLGSMLEDPTIVDELPELRRIVDAPYYALVNGKPVLLHENGYHEGAKVYMKMDPGLEKSVSGFDPNPNYKFIRRALAILHDMLQDFPWVSNADRAAAYAALILPFVRELIDGPTPLHLLDAPTVGTGKGLLADVIGIVTCGGTEEPNGFHTATVDDDKNRNVELFKTVTAHMAQVPRVLLLDNINHKLASGPISSALTNSTFSYRLFGKNDTVVEVPNSALWLATANNFMGSDEIIRRVVWCRMNAKVEHPAERTGFKHDRLEQYVAANRASVVWSVLTLVANWIAQGMPRGSVTMGSYEAWGSVVPGILECAGIDGLLDNRDEFSARASDESLALDALVDEWYAVFKREKVSGDDLLALQVSEEIVPLEARLRQKKFIDKLRGANEQVFCGHMIKVTKPGNRWTFELQEARGAVKEGDSIQPRRSTKRVPRRKRGENRAG